jgi:hypothetical protein
VKANQWSDWFGGTALGHLGFWRSLHATKNKKTDVIQYSKAFDHVGLLFNEPPGKAALLFI